MRFLLLVRLSKCSGNYIVHTFPQQLNVAAGRCVGEGFDDACVDTLFLVLPISWITHMGGEYG
jgi:hypothetical protein